MIYAAFVQLALVDNGEKRLEALDKIMEMLREDPEDNPYPAAIAPVNEDELL